MARGEEKECTSANCFLTLFWVDVYRRSGGVVRSWQNKAQQCQAEVRRPAHKRTHGMRHRNASSKPPPHLTVEAWRLWRAHFLIEAFHLCHYVTTSRGNLFQVPKSNLALQHSRLDLMSKLNSVMCVSIPPINFRMVAHDVTHTKQYPQVRHVGEWAPSIRLFRVARRANVRGRVQRHARGCCLLYTGGYLRAHRGTVSHLVNHDIQKPKKKSGNGNRCITDLLTTLILP